LHPRLDLWRRLAAYGDLRNRRIATLPRHKAAQAKIAFVGLQQRLLSSVAAFARTLKAHRRTLQKLIDAEQTESSPTAAQAFSEV
jgi:Skp family chaperone for outer membrane proteins